MIRLFFWGLLSITVCISASDKQTELPPMRPQSIVLQIINNSNKIGIITMDGVYNEIRPDDCLRITAEIDATTADIDVEGMVAGMKIYFNPETPKSSKTSIKRSQSYNLDGN